MDERTQQLFQHHRELLIAEAARRFGIDASAVHALGSFESAVYEITNGGRPLILKATDSVHRSPDAIRAELDWVTYLADREVPVCRPLASRAGRLVEVVNLPDETGTFVSLILFERAPGERLKKETLTEDFARHWGACVGRMNRMTRDFVPVSDRVRHHWHIDQDVEPSPRLCEQQPRVVERIHEVRRRLADLPQDRDSFGLVHGDLHHGNFMVHDGRLMLFDTDDCQYDWFVNDLAMPLYYTFRDPNIGGETTEFAAWFLRHYLEGYYREFDLGRTWLPHIADFLKWREMLLYMVIDRENLGEIDPWCIRFLKGRRERIENAVPVIDLDFSQF